MASQAGLPIRMEQIVLLRARVATWFWPAEEGFRRAAGCDRQASGSRMLERYGEPQWPFMMSGGRIEVRRQAAALPALARRCSTRIGQRIRAIGSYIPIRGFFYPAPEILGREIVGWIV